MIMFMIVGLQYMWNFQNKGSLHAQVVSPYLFCPLNYLPQVMHNY
jgi:hypothetical protein